MRILVLGASSNIGSALAEAFASGNRLILAGRNADKLNLAVKLCLKAGAVEADYVSVDFRVEVALLMQAVGDKHIDLIIDAASSSSQKRDSALTANDMPDLVSIDFVSRTKIFSHLLVNQRSAPAVIFISTVLALVKSPDRQVYTALKELYGAYLRKLAETQAGFRLLVVYVGKVIPTDRVSCESRELAVSVVQAYRENRSEMIYGLSGRFLVSLYNLQPIIFRCVTHAQRRFRGRFS
jgi:short-subunit dehydrogenase